MGRPMQGCARRRARTQALAPQRKHHTIVPVSSKQCPPPATSSDAAAAAAWRAHRPTAEPGQREQQSAVLEADERWQTRHCHGRAPCVRTQAISCPPRTTGISARRRAGRRHCAGPPASLLGAASESRRACGPQALAASVTRAIHQAMQLTLASWSAMASRMAAGTRCSRTASLASRSARSLPFLSIAVRSAPLPRRLLPTSATHVCAGIQERSSGGLSPVAAKISAQTRAVSRLGQTARCLPAYSKSTTALQSIRKAGHRATSVAADPASSAAP